MNHGIRRLTTECSLNSKVETDSTRFISSQPNWITLFMDNHACFSTQKFNKNTILEKKRDDRASKIHYICSSEVEIA